MSKKLLPLIVLAPAMLLASCVNNTPQSTTEIELSTLTSVEPEDPHALPSHGGMYYDVTISDKLSGEMNTAAIQALTSNIDGGGIKSIDYQMRTEGPITGGTYYAGRNTKITAYSNLVCESVGTIYENGTTWQPEWYYTANKSDHYFVEKGKMYWITQLYSNGGSMGSDIYDVMGPLEYDSTKDILSYVDGVQDLFKLSSLAIEFGKDAKGKNVGYVAVETTEVEFATTTNVKIITEYIFNYDDVLETGNPWHIGIAIGKYHYQNDQHEDLPVEQWTQVDFDQIDYLIEYGAREAYSKQSELVGKLAQPTFKSGFVNSESASATVNEAGTSYESIGEFAFLGTATTRELLFDDGKKVKASSSYTATFPAGKAICFTGHGSYCYFESADENSAPEMKSKRFDGLNPTVTVSGDLGADLKQIEDNGKTTFYSSKTLDVSLDVEAEFVLVDKSTYTLTLKLTIKSIAEQQL